MKLVIAFAVCLMALALAVPLEIQQQFSEWQSAHGRVYASTAEQNVRMAHFARNYLEVAELNKAESHLSNGATFKLNHFADWSIEELASLRGFKTSAVNTTEWKQAAPSKVNAPDSVDWRTKGVLPAIKDQGQCGSCWAFSATSNVESTLAVKGGSVTSLSEQYLVDCEKNCGQYRFMNGCDDGCNGGLQPNAWKYVISKGQPTEASYPYHARRGQCKSATSAAKVSNWEWVPEDEAQMADYVATKGPFAVAVDAQRWSFYNGGIMSSSSICPANDKSLDHAVNVVGYGTENGTPYWIIRNSWNTNWGEQGYARIARGKSYCGVQLFACSTVA